ncbi:DUF2264 domain-containing protein [bacterium]|nr:DUF2264 domain-containing protein [bacterium]
MKRFHSLASGLSGLALAAVCLAPGLSAAAQKTETTSPMQPQAVLNIPEDRALSPYTGYTRAHWLAITEKLILGVLPCFDPKTGMPVLKGTPGETGHFQHLFDVAGARETFDRTMTLVAFYTAATGKDVIPGWKGSIVEPYLKEVIRGTDPSNPGYWGPHPKTDVFGTCLATAILASPRFFWDPLTEAQKKNVLAYLQDLVHTFAYDCNHWYFHMAAVPVLERAGMENNREFLSQMFRRMLDWHRGDGWFMDGGNRSFDMYNYWGFQLYNQQLMCYDQKWHDQFGAEVNRTTDEFLKSFPYLFGRDGGPVPYGRSTTYRFAMLSALGWAQLNGANTLDPGMSRRIASGCLKYFWENGCLSANGLLEPGYRGVNSAVAEPYIDRGAPYWAAQGLCCLLLPEKDPFWTALEKPMPADGAGGRVALPGAQMLLKVSPVDGEARLYPVGQTFTHWGAWQRGVKYCQLAYSSYLGWAVTGEGGPDLGAGRTGFSQDGNKWKWREKPRVIQVSDDHLEGREYMEFPDTLFPAGDYDDYGEIHTHTLVGTDGEVHVFWHDSGRPVYLWLGGYSISVPQGGKLESEKAQGRLEIAGGGNHSLIRVLQGPAGVLQSELVEPRPGWLHSHNFGGRGAYPFWHSTEPVGANVPVVVYVNGTRGRTPVEPQSLAVRTERDRMYITFEGREYCIRVPY